MKLFKIDESKLFEKYFNKMTVNEFFALDTIPKGVDETEMRNMAEFLKKVKTENSELELGEVTIGDIITNLYVQSLEDNADF